MIRVLIIILGFVSIQLSGQRDLMMTQYMNTKMYLNPALAGAVETTEIAGVYRNQWISFPGAPEGQSLAVNIPRITTNIGLGFGLDRYSIGIYNRIRLSGNYSFGFKVGSGRLALGLESAVHRYSAAFSDPNVRIIEDITKDPSIPDENYYKTHLNAGFGIYYYNDDIYWGASVKNMIGASLDFDTNDFDSKEQQVYYVMGGYRRSVTEYVMWQPQFLVRYTEGFKPSFDINNSFYIRDRYVAGISYRSGGEASSIGESLDILLGMDILKNLQLTASYDIGLSDLVRYHNGSMEVGLVYRFDHAPKEVRQVNPRHFE